MQVIMGQGITGICSQSHCMQSLNATTAVSLQWKEALPVGEYSTQPSEVCFMF